MPFGDWASSPESEYARFIVSMWLDPALISVSLKIASFRYDFPTVCKVQSGAFNVLTFLTL